MILFFFTKSPWNQCFKDPILVNGSKSFDPQQGWVGKMQEMGDERLASLRADWPDDRPGLGETLGLGAGGGVG